MARRIDWVKVLANGGSAFFASLLSILTIDVLTNSSIPKDVIIPAALVTGLLYACVAVFNEIKIEVSIDERKTKRKGFTSLMLVFN